MLNWLKNATSSAREKLQEEVTKFKNREFMESVVAGCALVAAADGNISAEEKQKMVGFIQNSDELKVFKIDQVIDTFAKVCAKFEFDAEIGKAEALKIIGKLNGNNDAARLMIRVCCAIGAADGEFDQEEQNVVRLICNELGQSPAEFNL